MVEGSTASAQAELGVPLEEWREFALCRESLVDFFPGSGDDRRGPTDFLSIRAIRICMECPVRIECLEYSLRTKQRFGIWGGLVPKERRRILKMRARSRQESSQ